MTLPNFIMDFWNNLSSGFIYTLIFFVVLGFIFLTLLIIYLSWKRNTTR